MRILPFLFLFIISVSSMPASNTNLRDSIPYCEVFYNGTLLKRFDQNQKDFNLHLRTRQMRSSDVLTITYFEDVVMNSCENNLKIKDKDGREIKVIMIDELNYIDTYRLEAKEIFRLADKSESKKLNFFVRYDQFTYNKFLFRLHID